MDFLFVLKINKKNNHMNHTTLSVINVFSILTGDIISTSSIVRLPVVLNENETGNYFEFDLGAYCEETNMIESYFIEYQLKTKESFFIQPLFNNSDCIHIG